MIILEHYERTYLHTSVHNVGDGTVLQEPPYVIVKDPNGKGNDNYEGFMIELLQKISERAKFTYRITLAPDGKYGAEETRGQWTGMIGEVMKQVEYYDSV